MNFKAIQDAVLADGFDESSRAACKTWIQFRHGWLWDLADWDFKYATATVTFTAGSQIAANVPTDFQDPVALYDSNGAPVAPIADYREFFDSYNTNLAGGSGTPDAYTVLAGQLLVGPNGDGTTGLLIYRRSKPSLVEDADATGLPDGYDLALVHGGKAEGFKLANVPLWQGFDDDFTAAAQALQQTHVGAVKVGGSQVLARYDQWC